MTRAQLISHIASETQLPASQVQQVLLSMCETVTDTIAHGENVTIAGFGRFDRRARKEKTYVNPKTKEVKQLEPMFTLGFKPSGAVRGRVKK